MTKDELKRKLRAAWALQKQIDTMNAELAQLRDNAGKITPAYSLAPGGSSGNGQKIEAAVVKIADLEMAINDDIVKMVLAIQEIRGLIAGVQDDKQRIVLYKRYLEYQKWENIAVELDLDIRWVHRIHGRALNEILKTRH